MRKIICDCCGAESSDGNGWYELKVCPLGEKEVRVTLELCPDCFSGKKVTIFIERESKPVIDYGKKDRD